MDTIASTVPSNGDINPYGVAIAPATTGKLMRGDILLATSTSAKLAGYWHDDRESRAGVVSSQCSHPKHKGIHRKIQQAYQAAIHGKTSKYAERLALVK